MLFLQYRASYPVMAGPQARRPPPKKAAPGSRPFVAETVRRWLHPRALDALPARLNRLHGDFGQRHIVQAQRQLVALFKAPLEEFERVLGRLLVRRILVDKDVGGGGDRP